MEEVGKSLKDAGGSLGLTFLSGEGFPGCTSFSRYKYRGRKQIYWWELPLWEPSRTGCRQGVKGSKEVIKPNNVVIQNDGLVGMMGLGK